MFIYDLINHIERQQKFSFETFGPGARTKAVLDHIRKELVEIEANDHDLEEWIDVVLLALDGAWRAGYTPEQIVSALRGKLVKNMTRQWPDWRTQDPNKGIQHIRD